MRATGRRAEITIERVELAARGRGRAAVREVAVGPLEEITAGGDVRVEWRYTRAHALAERLDHALRQRAGAVEPGLREDYGEVVVADSCRDGPATGAAGEGSCVSSISRAHSRARRAAAFT